MTNTSLVIGGKKILCRVWNGKMNQVIAKKTVRYGDPYFNVKIGKVVRKFKINYNTEATIKQDGKTYLYDTNFDNTVGALRFYSFSEHEVIASDEAYTVLDNNAVKLYVQKGGIPLIYLAIAMIAVVAMAFAIILTVPDGLNAQERTRELDTLVTSLKQQNSILLQENANLRQGSTP